MQWEKGRVLGHGGSSIVYECFITDTTGTTGTTATTKGAVKEINKSGLSVQQLKVIEAEIDLLRALTHPNVVQYLGTEYTSTHFYIFMEEASCGSLRQLYTTHGALNENMIKYFLQQVLRGLYYLHLKGVAHRDIKAANILITYDGTNIIIILT
jgi:serine/threonine protein kinase